MAVLMKFLLFTIKENSFFSIINKRKRNKTKSVRKTEQLTKIKLNGNKITKTKYIKIFFLSNTTNL